MTGDPALEARRYPVGRFERVDAPDREERAGWIADIRALPDRLRAVIGGLDEEKLNAPYREDGWTIRQVVHHLADSHINGYVRMMLALAEEGRSAALYDQTRWADQAFARTGPVDASLTLLEGLHARWAAVLDGVSDDAFRRTIDHPEMGEVTVEDLTNLYAWHSRHHVAHVRGLREREGW